MEKLRLANFKLLSRNEMKLILAGSGGGDLCSNQGCSGVCTFQSGDCQGQEGECRLNDEDCLCAGAC